MPAPRRRATAACAPVNPRRLQTFAYLLKVRLTRALAQSESPNPGRMKRQYIGSKNIALPLHGERCRGRGVALFCLCPPATRARRWPSRDRRVATTAVATMVPRSR